MLQQSALLTWSGANANTCSASGEWSGIKAVSGQQTVTPTSIGDKTYMLTCSGTGGSNSNSMIVHVTTTPPVCPNNVCEAGETTTTCPADCAVASNIIGGQTPTVTPCPTSAGYSCLASCLSDLAFCVNRTDYGQRNCAANMVCCKEQAISNCILPAAACTVKIETKRCDWDPVALNYSITVQAGWSGGSYVRVSAAGVTSQQITAKPAIFTMRSATGGSKDIAATVYSSADGLQCYNTTSVACNPSGQQPAPSPLPGLAMSLATASSFTVGNAAGKAIDDDAFTGWQSSGPLPQWLKLDLGYVQTINGTGIYSTAGKPRDFVIRVSQNDVTYTSVASVHSAEYASDWNVTTFNAIDARYVLINVTAADGGVASIYEVKVYSGAPPALAAVPPSVPTPGIPIFVYVIVAGAAAAVVLLLFRGRIALWWSYTRA